MKKSRRPGWVEGKFLRGPIALSWLGRVCRLPGRAVLATALAIRFKAGLCGRKDGLELTGPTAHLFNVRPSAKSRALDTLEAAGLIKVERRGKKNPLVTILDVEDEGTDNRMPGKQDSDSLAC